jgi:lipopolysaccharide/colanic/teichoic acid biosynthesis glycosyltransferase
MNILYLGQDNEVANTLENISPSLLIVDSPIRLLKMKTALAKIDLVVADKFQKGINISKLPFVLIEDGINKEASIVIYGKEFNSEERAAYIKSGISEIASDIAQLKVVLAFVTTNSNATNIKKVHVPNLTQWTKRIFDITFALVFLVLTAPVLLLIVLAIRLDSKGPIVYKSKRVGQGYKVFDFLKFRTMRVNADSMVREMKELNQYENEDLKIATSNNTNLNETLIDALGNPIDEETFIYQKKAEKSGAFFKIQNDPRITRVGGFLRSTSLDELPQFINVLDGDMSIIGNRPLPLYEAEQLTTDEWAARFMAPAGITGLWQVKKRGKAGMSETERKELDNYYAQNSSFLFDIQIMLQTIPALFQKENV